MARRKVRLTKDEIDRLNAKGDYNFTLAYRIVAEKVPKDTPDIVEDVEAPPCYRCGGCGWLGVPDELCICVKEGLPGYRPPVTETDQDEAIDDGIF